MMKIEQATQQWDLPHQLDIAGGSCRCGRPFTDGLHQAPVETASDNVDLVTEKGV